MFSKISFGDKTHFHRIEIFRLTTYFSGIFFGFTCKYSEKNISKCFTGEYI